jgi:hypothetical protein
MSPNGVLYWIGGAASTLVGAWVSSKIHVYHDHREKHHDELKQKVLEPIRRSLEDSYRPFLNSGTLGADVIPIDGWFNPFAPVTRDPIVPSVSLAISDPALDATLNIERALLQDSKANHYAKLVAGWEQLRDSITGHINRRAQWVQEMGRHIQESSPDLVAFAPNRDQDYVMHLKLAAFVHGRFFETDRLNLMISNLEINRSEITTASLILGSITVAKGTLQQVEHLIEVVENLRHREEPRATQFRYDVRKLQAALENLCDEFSFAIAAKKLENRCALVPFF